MRVLNKKYWPYQFDMTAGMPPITELDSRETWCEENLNPDQWRSFGWQIKTFAFKNAEDATVFKLMFK